ncbi:MAG: hypothetical protein HW397_625 [Dehalococcoidia bacterium]|nr:hypothetical protein [Dehalococcoidia bacterium]
MELLEAQVTSLTKQVADLNKRDTSVELSSLADGLANDRLLLVELRKDLPADRTAARLYWTRIKDLSVKSSPTLPIKADKVITSIQAYFSWRERDYPSANEQAITYVLTGANAYDGASKDFWNSFLKVAIDRMDAIALTTP